MKNFSGFKKIAADKKSTTFAHPNGSKLTVAHEGLDRHTMKSMASLPFHKFDSGGDVGSNPLDPDPQKAREAMRGAEEGETLAKGWRNLKSEFGFGEKSKAPQRYSGESGDPSDSEVSSDQDAAAPQAPVNININASPQPQQADPGIMQQAGQFVGKHMIAPTLFDIRKIGQTAGNLTQGVESFGSGMGTALDQSNGIAPAAAPQVQSTPGQQFGEVPHAPQPTAEQLSSTDPMQQYMNVVGQGVGNEISGIQSGANVETQKAAQEAEQLQKSADQREAYIGEVKKNFQILNGERRDAMQDLLDQHIEPNHYLESQDAGQKVSTAIGLLLGGMSGGILHTGQNPAMDFINKQIDRDIDAQKTNLGTRKTILEANLRQFGNLEQATQMTRVLMNDFYSTQIAQTAAKFAGPKAQAAAQVAIGQLQSQNGMILGNLAASKAQQKLSGAGTPVARSSDDQIRNQIQMLRMAGMKDRAEDLESRYIPGVGVAGVKVPDKVREELISRQELQSKIDDLRNWSSAHSGDLNPADIRQGRTKAMLVQDAYRRANGQGVFREAESKFVNNIVDQKPTEFLNQYRSGKGYQELGRDNMSSLNSLRRGFGLPEAKAASQIQMKNGVPYMKVPGGWKRAG